MSQNRRKPPTLNDVAALAGVSAQTVSNYLSGRYKPRKDNLERLDAAIKKLGYRPSAAARALRMKQSNIIAMLLEDGSDSAVEMSREGWEPLHAMFLYGATTKARELGYYITTVLTKQGAAEEAAIRLVREGRADGLICSTELMPDAQLRRLQKVAQTEHVPIAMLQESRPHENICNVTADDESGAALVAEHLASLGHRHVAVMMVRPLWPGPARRHQGFEAAAHRLGLRMETWEAESYSVDAIRACAKTQLERGDRPTAVFAVNDIIAIAIMQQAIELGLNIPNELSIVGFNDLAIASYFRPAISTVKTPAVAMGARAVEILADHIAGSPLAPGAALPIEFVARESSGPAPGVRGNDLAGPQTGNQCTESGEKPAASNKVQPTP